MFLINIQLKNYLLAVRDLVFFKRLKTFNTLSDLNCQSLLISSNILIFNSMNQKSSIIISL